jgi:hypothetical protein
VTKRERDPRQWSNEEIAKDTQGYLAAQQAFIEDRDAAQIRRREVDDLSRFTASFVRAGGKREDAEEAFWSQRNEGAAERARREDDDVLLASRRNVRRGL